MAQVSFQSYDQNCTNKVREISLAIYPTLLKNTMQFLVNHTSHEMIFNRVKKKIKKGIVKKTASCKHISESKEISISIELIHQLFKAFHQIDKCLINAILDGGGGGANLPSTCFCFS